MSGSTIALTDFDAADETIAGAASIDLSQRTTPITLHLTGGAAGGTQVLAGTGTLTLDASTDVDTVTIAGNSGALFLRAGAGAITLNNTVGAAYVTGGTGTIDVVANGPVALLPGEGLITVTNTLSGVTVYGNIPSSGFVPFGTALPNLTRLTARFIPSGQSRTVNGNTFGNDNEITTATGAGAGDTYFMESGFGAGNSVAFDEDHPGDATTFLDFTASVLTPSTPTAVAVWNPGTQRYDVTVTGQANGGTEGVFVSIDGAEAATTVSAANGTFSATAHLSVAIGAHSVTAAVYDPTVGGFATSGAASFNAPPPAPVITGVDPSPVAGTVLSATGTAAAGALVRIAVDGVTQSQTATASGSGAWTIDLPGPFARGPHTLVASVSGAGASNSFSVAVSSADPTIGAVLRNNAAPAGTKFSMTGTADPNATVTVRVDGAALAQTVTAGASGSWTTDVGGVSAGSHSVTVTTIDANSGGTRSSGAQTVVVAAPPVLSVPVPGGSGLTLNGTTSAPGAVTIAVDGNVVGTVTPASGAFAIALGTLAAGSHTISASQTEALTATPGTASETIVVPRAPTLTQTVVNGQLRFAGTADQGSVVTIHRGALPVQTVTAGVGGTWSLTVAIPTVPTMAYASVPDPYVSAGTLASVSVALPVAPAIIGDDPAAPAGTAFSAAGTAAPGATVRLTIDGASTPRTVTANSAGAWSIDVPGPVSAGPHTIVASVTDAAGDVLSSATHTDLVASVAPTVTGPVLSPGAVAGTLFTLAGTADPNAVVIIELDGDPASDTAILADANGDWLIDIVGSGGGSATITASSVDANTGFTLNSAPLTVTLVEPVITRAGFTTSSADFVVAGTAAAGAVVTLTLDTGAAVTVTADGSGAFTRTFGPLAAGPHSVIASTPDPYGLQTLASAAASVTVPGAPSILSALPNGSGAIVVSGTADPNATVTILDGAAVDGTTTANGAGLFTYTVQSPGNVASVTATIVSSAYPALSSATVAPPFTAVPPTIAGPDPNAPPGALFSLTGQASPGATLTVSLGGAQVGTTLADGAGAWSYDQLAPVVAGARVATVHPLGAPSGPAYTASRPVVVASRAPTIGASSRSAAPPGTVLSVHGTADPGATVTLTDNGAVLPVTIVAQSDGTWFADLSGVSLSGGSLSGPSGVQTLRAATPDANGGPVLRSATVSVTLPAAPVIVFASVSPGANGGPTAVTVYGTAPAGTPVALTDAAGASLGAATADAQGHFGLLGTYAPSGFDFASVRASVADAYAPSGTVSSAVAPPYAAPAVAPVVTGFGPAPTPSLSQVVVGGTANPGAVVTVTLGASGITATAQADVDGVWRAVMAAPASGTYAVTARVPAGAGVLTSGPASLRIAQTPALTGEDTSAAPAGTALELHGTADPRASVTVTLDGQAAGTVRADAQGNWLLDLAAAAAGSHTVGLSAYDPVRGVTLSATAAPFALLAPAILSASADGAHFVTVTGTAAAGAAVTVYSDTLLRPVTVTADGAGRWRAGFTGTAGEHGVIAGAYDPGRQAEGRSAATAFTVPLAVTAASTDPAQLALQAAQAAARTGAAGTELGTGLANVTAAGLLGSAVIAPGAAGTAYTPAGVQLLVSQAAAPLTLQGNGVYAIVQNAGGQLRFMTNGGSGVFLDGASGTDDRFETPMQGGGSYLVQLGRGNNLVDAHSGDVTVLGGTGNNAIWTGSGRATVALSGVGQDTVTLGTGTASVHAAGRSNAVVIGRGGDFTFDNNSGSATVSGGTGSTTIHAWDGTGTFWGGSGGHSQLSANSHCILVSEGLDDTLYAWGSYNELWAVHGNATIRAVGTGGHNLLVGGDGNDWMSGGLGGNDTLLGGLGNSTLWGGTGDELIQCSQKTSIVYAGIGNETLVAGGGTDDFVFFKRPGVHTYEVRGFRHGQDHVGFADHARADWTRALQTQSSGGNAATLTLDDGTRIVFAGLDRITAADVR